MRKVPILLWRELAAYFNSPVAYVVIPVFLLVFGIFFFYIPDFFRANQAGLTRFFNIAPFVTALFAPAMTMRLFAEETRAGTFELLATMPIEDREIVLGKYLGAFALMVIGWGLTLSYVLTVAMLGAPDWGPIIGGYLGLLLMSGAYLAIGTLMSSLTGNQIVAFFAALFVGLCLLFIDVAVLLYLPGWLIPIAEFLSFNHHFQSIARGVLDLRDIVFYLSAIVLCLFLAVHRLRMSRLA